MWILIGVLLGLMAVGVVLALAPRVGDERQLVTADQLFVVGIVYTGTGVALVSTIGPGTIGILALGIVFMGVGASRRRQQVTRHD